MNKFQLKEELNGWELIYLKLKKMAWEHIQWQPEKAEFWNEKLDELDKANERIKGYFEKEISNSENLKLASPDIGDMPVPSAWEEPGAINTSNLF